MNIQKLKDEITEEEGRINYVYSDIDGKPTWPKRDKGNPTFGIGHKLSPRDLEWDAFKRLQAGGKLSISDKRIDEVFQNDIAICLNGCKSAFSNFDLMPEELKLILANMIFNLGLANFFGFDKFILAIKSANYINAAEEMRDSLWYRELPERAERLRKRMMKLAKPEFPKKVSLTKEECQNVSMEKNVQRSQKNA